MARELGFQYIWIDTLCIIQDDETDWQMEASSMAGVYGRSALNLAASGASDGNMGLFFQRPSHWRRQVQFQDSHKIQHYELVPHFLYNRVLSEALFSDGGGLSRKECFHNERYILQALRCSRNVTKIRLVRRFHTAYLDSVHR